MIGARFWAGLAAVGGLAVWLSATIFKAEKRGKNDAENEIRQADADRAEDIRVRVDRERVQPDNGDGYRD